MKMMTKELEAAFLAQGSTEGKKEEEITVLAHFFTGAGAWDWWATEYKDGMFFGLVSGFEVELGYFSLQELEENSCNVRPLGGVERDLYWSTKSLAEVRHEAMKRRGEV
ncbi:MAG: hypothetical protein A2089_03840 [Elusimicrobia bacterium GWD2_63_28]|nr:MAG: hypothetical protein A2089_03840 [Elusimicrobia bacterium GWD2_63_28]